MEGYLIPWSDPNLSRISLLELTCEHDKYRVSQVLGVMKDGSEVMVAVPFSYLPRWGMRHEIVRWAKKDKVYAHGLELFSSISTDG